MTTQQSNIAARQHLVALRFIWGAMLFAPVAFMAILIIFVLPHRQPRLEGDPMTKMNFMACMTILITVLPIGYALRALAYGKRRGDGTIAPARYSAGNILLWTACEGISFMALIFMMLDGKPFPFLWLALFAMANQAINVPTGRRLAPTVADVSAHQGEIA